ncbi:right-handed parallel beta-helix repeat-containing protein [Verrucomicrobiaceae bacterium 227]
MKHALFFSLLTCFRLSAATWFVSPTGSNEASGSLEHPFATIQHAHDQTSPGDTVFIRGGTYKIQENQTASMRRGIARVIYLHKSGETGKPVTYSNYRDEQPILDFSGVKPDKQRVYAFSVSASWIHVKGLAITGVQVTIKGHTQSISLESNGSDNIFERLSLHDSQAIGIYHVRGSNNLFLNCDAWNNHDVTSEDGRGGNTDGFGCHPTKGSTGNVFRGCRAWFNSDDGFDLISAHETVTIENCWALFNGYSPDFKPLADGHGFKAGGYGSTPLNRLPKTAPRHVVKFCVAAKNKSSGFYANHHPGGLDWFHNSSYRHGLNFLMLNRKPGTFTDVDGFDHRLHFNLGMGSSRNLSKIDLSNCELKGNLLSPESIPKNSDFLSLDETELLSPRKDDGSLPKVSFLKPVDSQKINAGAF